MSETDFIPPINLIQTGEEKKESQGMPVSLEEEKAVGGLKGQDSQLPKTGKKKIWLWPLLVIVLFLVFNLAAFYGLYRQSSAFLKNALDLKSSLATKNLDQVKTSLSNSRQSLVSLKKAYRLLSWESFVPFFGVYITDLGHGLTAADYSLEALNSGLEILAPHLDLLGFSSASSGSGGATVDRITFITQTLPDILPKTGSVIEKLNKVQVELVNIDPKHYPVRLGKYQVRDKLETGLDQANYYLTLVKNSEPILQQLPYILGLDTARHYFLVFQNDKELRPTGGFITAYAVMKVEKATFQPTASDDIYNLDSKYKPVLTAPEPIVKYIAGPYALSDKWRLRDLNWSPDFAESMKVFETEIGKLGFDDIDGIIAVDTQFLVDILKVLGPVGVSGYGNFSTETVSECNCPQVIYELESFADIEGPIVWDPAGTGKIIYAPANWQNRKKIIGPLMNTIAANALGQPAEKLPSLLTAFLKSLEEGHILFYFNDEKTQTAAEKFGAAGRISNFDGDYLYINDANLGGRKSNLYVTQEVSQEITVDKEGNVIKKVMIIYKNPEKYDGWLNSVLPNWVRIYVPQGSRLLSLNGLEDKVEPYDEAGKTVFAGFFQLRPEGMVKVELEYQLPFKVNDSYRLLIQKQPGKGASLYTVAFNGKSQEFSLEKDMTLKFK